MISSREGSEGQEGWGLLIYGVTIGLYYSSHAQLHTQLLTHTHTHTLDYISHIASSWPEVMATVIHTHSCTHTSTHPHAVLDKETMDNHVLPGDCVFRGVLQATVFSVVTVFSLATVFSAAFCRSFDSECP